MYPPKKALNAEQQANLDKYRSEQEGISHISQGAKTVNGDNLDANQVANENDYYADTQSFGEKLKNTLIKNTAKAGLRYAQSLTTLATSLPEMIDYVAGTEMYEANKKRKGVAGALDVLSDNKINSSIFAPAEEWLNENYKVRETQKEQESWSLLNMGGLDKLLDGVAYVAGMAGGGKFVNLTAKALGKTAQLASIGKKAGYAGSFLDDVATVAGKTTDAVADGLKKGSQFRDVASDLVGSIVESGAEANETKKQIVETKTQALLEEKQKLNPNATLSDEEKQQIEKESQVAGGVNFISNVILTSLASRFVFAPLAQTKYGKILTGQEKIEKNLVGAVQRSADKTAYEVLKKSDKWYKKALANQALTKGIKNAGVEGLQEGEQFYSNEYIQNLLESPEKETVDDFSDLLKLSSKDLVTAFQESNKQVGSVESIQSVLLGSIIGGGAGVIGGRMNQTAEDANTERLIGEANQEKFSGKDFASASKMMMKSKEHTQIADGAVYNGDKFTAKDHESLSAIRYVQSRQALNRTEDVIDDLDLDSQLPLTEFKAKYGINDNTYTEKDQKETLDNLKTFVEKVDKSTKSINDAFGHKIREISKKEGNESMLQDIVALDVFQDTMQDRMTSLEEKFKNAGVDFKTILNRVATPEYIAEIEGEIATKTEELQVLGQESISPEIVAQRTKVLTEIKHAQDRLANVTSELNLTEQLGRDLSKTPAKQETIKYSKYSKDLNDYKKIHEAKNKVVDFMHQIINDVNYYDNLKTEEKNRKYNKQVVSDFTIKGNFTPTEKEDTTTYTYDEGEDTETIIEKGDFVRLNNDIYEKKDKDDIGGATSELMEVIDTSYDNKTPMVTVKNISINGNIRKITMQEFKKRVQPINEYTPSIKKDYTDEGFKLFKKYRSRAVTLKDPKTGELILGMLGIKDAYVLNEKTNEIDPVTKQPIFKKKLINEDRLQINYIGSKGLMEQKTISYSYLRDNLINVYDADRSHLFRLKLYAPSYIKLIQTSIDNTAKKDKELKEELELLIKASKKKKNKDTTQDYPTLISELQFQIDKNNANSASEEFTTALLEKYEQVKDFDITEENVPDELKPIYEVVNKFYSIKNKLELEEEILKKEKFKFVENNEIKNALQEVTTAYDIFIDDIEKVNNYKFNKLLNEIEEIEKPTDEQFRALKNLKDVLLKNKMSQAEEAKEYYAKISAELGEDAEVVKKSQIELIAKWNKWQQQSSFKYSIANAQQFSIEKEEYNSVKEDRESILVADIKNGKSTAPKTYPETNEIYPELLQEQQNFHMYAHLLDYDTEFEIELLNDKDVFLRADVNGVKTGVFLSQNAQTAPLIQQIKDQKDNLDKLRLKGISKTANYTINTDENKVLISPQKIEKDLGEELELIVGDGNAVQIGGEATYITTSGRVYLANDKKGVFLPILTQRMENVKIVDKSVTEFMLSKLIQFSNGKELFGPNATNKLSFIGKTFNELFFTSPLDNIKEGSMNVRRDSATNTWFATYKQNNEVNKIALTRIQEGVVVPTEEGIAFLNNRLLNINSKLLKAGNIKLYEFGKPIIDMPYIDFLKENGVGVSIKQDKKIAYKTEGYFGGATFRFSSDSLVEPTKEKVEKKIEKNEDEELFDSNLTTIEDILKALASKPTNTATAEKLQIFKEVILNTFENEINTIKGFKDALESIFNTDNALNNFLEYIDPPQQAIISKFIKNNLDKNGNFTKPKEKESNKELIENDIDNLLKGNIVKVSSEENPNACIVPKSSSVPLW